MTVPEHGRAVSILWRLRFVVLLFWATLTCLGAAFATRFTNNTYIDFSVPEASEGYADDQEFQRLFPSTEDPVTVLVRRADEGSVVGPALHNLTDSVVSWAETAALESSSVQGYFIMVDRGLPELGVAFVNDVADPNASTASLIVVSLPRNASGLLAEDLRHHVLAAAPNSLEVELAGEPYFLQASLDGVTHDLEQVHPKVVPFALIPFLYIVRSWRLSLITLACIAASAASAYFVMWPISETVAVANFAPSMMLSAVLATSIDYSLFLLSRFREESAEDSDAEGVKRALATALHFAGHTVLVSGTTLALCFFGLLFFPVGLISSLGLATGLTICISIAVNLTLLPALLLAFPAFFTRRGWCCCGGPRRARQRAEERRRVAELRAAAASSSSAEEDLEEEGGSGRGAGSPAAGARRGTGEGPRASLVRKEAGASTLLPRSGRKLTCWGLVSSVSMRCGFVVVALFVGAGVPCALEVSRIETSISQEEMMPRDAPASRAYADLVAAFGSGGLFPFKVLVQPQDGAVDSAAFFERARGLVRRALDLSGEAGALNATGVMMAGATDVPYDMVHQALHGSAQQCDVLARLLQRDACAEVRVAWAQFTNGDVDAGVNATATFVTVALDFDAFSARGVQWIRAMRAGLAQAANESQGLDCVGLSGGSLPMVDSVNLVYSYYPVMVGVTLGVVFALLGIAFRSLVVPLRAVLTISLSLVLTMGCAWLVYGRGALDGLGWVALSGQGALTWSAPVLAFPIMVGLGLDYDIFLLGRILEYRLAAYTDVESVTAGVEHSGPLISAAGVIMAIAFGALLFSSSTSLNELAFLLTASVLVDTFLVRTVLVPSVMGLLGKRNWWPRTLPPPLPPMTLMPLPPPPVGEPPSGGSGASLRGDGLPDYETIQSTHDAAHAAIMQARLSMTGEGEHAGSGDHQPLEHAGPGDPAFVSTDDGDAGAAVGASASGDRTGDSVTSPAASPTTTRS